MTTDTDTEEAPSYPDGEEPTTPPIERECFDPATEWVNYWDHNPVKHGGRFVRWDADSGRWKVVEVTPPSAHPMDEGLYLLTVHRFAPSDVWADPDDPLTGWSDSMAKEVDALHDSPQLPNAEPFVSAVDYHVAGLVHRIRPSDSGSFTAATVAEYWDTVSDYGVDPSEVQGVADDDLPADVTDD
jgi:hypothetical protein